LIEIPRMANAIGNAAAQSRLEEAVAAYRAALEERTRERVPLDWAATFGNQGLAMMVIADRTNDGALAETAVTQVAVAYETMRDGGHSQGAAMFKADLTKAQAIRDRLKGNEREVNQRGQCP
jgi:hypothetical protein